MNASEKKRPVFLKTLSYLGLAFTLIPSFLVFSAGLSLDTYKNLMLAGTFLWLTTAPFWINKE